MRERDIQAKVVGYARRKGIIARKLNFGEGWPDFMFLYMGYVLFIEFKGGRGRLAALQEHIHELLRNHDFHVSTIDNVEAGNALIDKFVAQVDKGAVYSPDTRKTA